MNKLLISGLIAIFAVTASAADDGAKGFYVYPHFNHMLYDDLLGTDFDNEEGLGIAAGYQLGNNWSWEVAYDLIRPETSTGASVTTKLWELNSVYRFDTEDNWRPIVMFGFGNIKNSFNNGFSPDSSTYNVGAGMEYLLTDSIALRADVRAVTSFDNNNTDILTTIGFNFMLGETAKAVDSDGDGVVDGKDLCSGTPTGNAVNEKGCEFDSDNDSVVNSADQCPATPAGVSVDSKGCAVDSDGDGVTDHKDQCPETPAGALVAEDGCRKMLTENVEINLHLTFDTNKAEVKSEFSGQITKVADFMRQYPDTRVVIEGHSDSMGAASYNLSLSQRRAQAVADSLINNHKIDASRVSAKGFGESKPVADNATREGRKQNRRVVAQLSTTVTKPE